ncbi:hypothetical protein QGM71_01170 [Virgibacillus sp. C22-A2]|uniref:Holliday junction resolvase RuvC n=1 Tax=Virgibacillus tibetensis TaxID=3042313 RepID=A0ABU6KAI4_9BACI|nr:hypothetical protein [Virgibacillus sp. C22-A2]
MNYIGIDPSTKTGLVILNVEGNVLLEKEITTKEKSDPARFVDITKQIIPFINEGDKVLIEGFSYGSRGRGVSTQYGIGWAIRIKLLKLVRSKYISDYIEVSPNTLKKFATGKGNVKKEDMILPINDRWGYRNGSDNIRDAYVLAQIGRALDGHGKPAKAQLACIKELG